MLAFLSGCFTVTPPDPDSVTLTVTILAPEGTSGTVTSNPEGIDATSGSQSAEYEINTVVTLTATADDGSAFSGFTPTGICAPGTAENVCELLLETSTSVYAAFQPSSTVYESLDVVAASPVAGAYLEFTLSVGASLSTVVPLRDGVSARTAVVGDTVRLAWVAEAAREGDQVRIVFGTDGGINGTPVVVNALVLAEHDGLDLGASTLSLQGSSAADASSTPLIVNPVSHGADGTLLASFVDFPLGDLDRDGELSVRDALWLLERTKNGAAWTDFERYHADLDADDVTDTVDLERLLDKLVDPALPAHLHVKQAFVSFVQLDPATDEDAIVLIANGGRLPLTDLVWTPPENVEVANLGGIAGHAFQLSLPATATARRGWLPEFFRVATETEAVDVRVGNLVFLVAGQSNAVGLGESLSEWPETPSETVRMLGNDYVWRNATEPLDDATNQVDGVSKDGEVRYSFGTLLGNLVHDATGFNTYLIPSAMGNTKSGAWRPPSNRLDRLTLFGSANYRAQVSAGLIASQPYPAEGGPVSAVLWYQGEADRFSDGDRDRFVVNTGVIVNAFATELGAPTIAVQLASDCNATNHARMHAVAESQRRLETGSGAPDALTGYHLVVASDLPRSDCVHLSAFGQRLLAERIDLAVREHVLREAVDGTGPRLLSVSHSGLVVTIRTTHVLESGNLNLNLFTVWDGVPEGTADNQYSGYANTINVVQAVRDPNDPRAVLLSLAASVGGGQVPYVRYMANFSTEPAGLINNPPRYSEYWDIVTPGTIRAADGGLPLPAFGPLPPFGEP